MLRLFDIETIPQDEKRIVNMMPEEIRNPVLPPELQAMPPVEYKLGNLKDPAKCKTQEEATEAEKARQAKMEEQAKKHAQEWENRRDKALQGFSDKRLKWIEDAALCAELAHVRIISSTENNQIHCDIDVSSIPTPKEQRTFSEECSKKFPKVKFTMHKSETTLVQQFWINTHSALKSAAADSTTILAGFAIKFFDLPFMWRRALLLGIVPPKGCMNSRFPYCWEQPYIDLQEVWSAGNRDLRPSLDYCLKSFDLEPKSGTGDQFWRYWEADPIRAVEYSLTDIVRTGQLAVKMGYSPEDHIRGGTKSEKAEKELF